MTEYRCLTFHIAKRNIIDFHIGSFSKAYTFLTAFFRQPFQLFQSVYGCKYLCKGRYQPGKVQHRTLHFPHQLKKSGHCTESYSPRTETDTTPQKSGKIPSGKSQRYKRTCGKRKACTPQNLIAQRILPLVQLTDTVTTLLQCLYNRSMLQTLLNNSLYQAVTSANFMRIAMNTFHIITATQQKQRKDGYHNPRQKRV